MATVVVASAIKNRLAQLGWDTLNVTELIDAINQNAVPAVSLIAYLDAAILTPGGFNDATIAGVSVATATKITNYLKTKQLAVV